jgi:hypothetical protein
MSKLAACIVVFLISLSVSIGQPAQGTLIGQDSTNRIITTAVPFLGITPDARAAGMGDAGAATSADANSAYWNAAKLVRIDQSYGVAGSYTPWLGKIINDMSIFYLSGFYRIRKEEVVAASMKYFDLGEIQFNNGPLPENQLGRYNPREFAFDVTYSRELTQRFSIGGAVRYIHSNLTGSGIGGAVDARPANSVAVDMGVYYTKPFVSRNANLALGAAITNVGAKVSYSSSEFRDFIPGNLRIGGAYTTDLDVLNSITFALDFNKLLVPSPGAGSKSAPLLSGIFRSFTDARGGFSEEISEVTMSTGIEYWYNKTFAARLGYFLEARDKGNRKYLTAGAGFRVERFGLDVAYLVPTNRLENALAETLRFTLLINFLERTKENDSVTD